MPKTLAKRRILILTVIFVGLIQTQLASASSTSSAPYSSAFASKSTVGNASAESVADKTDGRLEATATATGRSPIAVPDPFRNWQNFAGGNATIVQNMRVESAGSYTATANLSSVTSTVGAAKGGKSPGGIEFDYSSAKAVVIFRLFYSPDSGGSQIYKVKELHASSASGGNLSVSNSFTVPGSGSVRLEIQATAEALANGEASNTYARATLRSVLSSLDITP